MDDYDVSAAASLRTLLENQSQRLRWVADALPGHGCLEGFVPTAGEWSGLAREAHDELVRRLMSQLASARASLDLAIAHSDHAFATLAGRA
ncbi:MAG: hypothetical protein KF801_05990 [Cryobacterium sp.]|nr:hypothetical protein [Cryobacterium sp.]